MRRWKVPLVMWVAIVAILATACRLEIPAMGGEPATTTVSAEITQLIKQTESNDWQSRASAARNLGLMRTCAAPAVPALLRLLGDHRDVPAVQSHRAFAPGMR